MGQGGYFHKGKHDVKSYSFLRPGGSHGYPGIKDSNQYCIEPAPELVSCSLNKNITKYDRRPSKLDEGQFLPMGSYSNFQISYVWIDKHIGDNLQMSDTREF